ncbi:hypothetical protein EVB81_161 [Rhizobium phage RHph_I46]|uniref:Uncharacterized protein n=1 Tax=Rhizobium phage RHph_I1_9 TaxID=2509729 RepID=A0A7S5R9Q2_9CAUD|nr:hypothetical protein PP936_gp160 [Rhizobium phage RHph_I1_9]QIG69730.1 hypothetical protein EVB81_161 [Rhizobium phage RHph_I46]QIG71011.1 hypothetical protein EVB92_161 [Rhizobium phage RHph_I9]QIG73597.1 hypothetical protein EVC04_160 [Rhizobium phage RHph_I1_9]QIG76350.1 hypothetical protein EVC25_161 [Rhizobium phage RHph_I34]
MITAEFIRDTSEENAIREASLHSPSFGKWMEFFIIESGNSLEDVSATLAVIKTFVDKEISVRDECLLKNGL